MKFFSEIFKAFKQVFSIHAYIYLSVIFASLMFVANVIYRNYSLIFSDFSFKLFFSLLIGFPQTTSVANLVILSLTFILAGTIISLSTYLLKRQLKTGLGSTSILVAIVAPACPTCAVGLFALVGLGGLIAYLPFKGLEIGFLGILILVVSIFYLSKKINTNVCTVKKKN